MTPTTDLALDDIQLGELSLWLRADREGIFTKLRAERPVSFHAEGDFPGVPRGPGFWAVTRYADVVRASMDAESFVSGHGVSIPDQTPELNEFFGSMINMDAPRHTKLRKLVSAGFTPRTIKQVEESVRAQARRIVDAVAAKGACDFVEEVAAALPLRIICDMMGIPEADHRRIFELTNIILGVGDPEYASSREELMAAALELFRYAQALAEARRTRPRDDITTALIDAEVDGERLTSQELGSFFILLVVAGNETTRNAISHGMRALTDFLAERARWMADFERIAPALHVSGPPELLLPSSSHGIRGGRGVFARPRWGVAGDHPAPIARRSRTTPPLITARIRASASRSSVGSPSTSSRSARLPSATTPKSGSFPSARKRAASRVAARIACAGVRPDSARQWSSRWRPAPGKTPACMSLPARIVTPVSCRRRTLSRQAPRCARIFSR